MMRRHPIHSRSTRRGSTVIIVVWAIAVAALLASSIQLFGFRQAAFGREALHRVQARWAARSGMESTLAIMSLHTEEPYPDDAFAMIRDMEAVAFGETYDATWDIRHHVDGRDWLGPMDEHSKMNINSASPADLDGALDDMRPEIISAINDWRDTDDEAGLLGAEEDHYLASSASYAPRNGDFRSVAELELVAGIWDDYLRGEDWNMNFRLDPSENDGDRTMPEDEPDGILETGWAGRLTAHSIDGGATSTGLPRLYLRRTTPEELMDRCYISFEQAERIIAFGSNTQNRIDQLMTTPLDAISETGTINSSGTQGPNSGTTTPLEPLTEEELRLVLAETTMLPLYERPPGRINLNTASVELLEDLMFARGIDEYITDEIIYLRNSRPEGITSLLDLRELPEMSDGLLDTLSTMFTTSSNIYTISVQGRSTASQTKVEIIAVVDRSTVPIRILEYREQ